MLQGTTPSRGLAIGKGGNFMRKVWSVCLALCMAFTLASPALAEAVPLAPAALEALEGFILFEE